MSAIAKNASISLLTGVPGNGKTLRAVWYIDKAIKAKEEVFFSNLNGLNIDGVNDFPDPTRWEELPAGSILVVDEAQRFFRAGTGAVPDYIKAMETVRHSGIRLILITQSPALVHANIRALVGLHEHLVRQNGKESATVYRRSRVIDNVRSERALASEDSEVWMFPKACYAMYKSAEVHTITRTIPSKHKRAAVMFAVAAAIFGVVAWKMREATQTPAQDSAAVPSARAGGAAAGSRRDTSGPRYASPTDYAKAHLPRFATMPWTAEIYDDSSPTGQPELYCMSSLPTASDMREPSCTCLTDQGTKYDISQGECRRVARYGVPYNPYKQESRPEFAAPPGQDLQRDAVTTASVISRGENQSQSFPEIASYKSASWR